MNIAESSVAPIALFVYSRPVHTRRTVESLQKNHLASDSDLVIFSDAAKTPDAEPAVQEVRCYLKTISGFKSIIIIERERNYGLAASIIDGVTRLCNEFGRVIVLEDDLVTSPYFLKFMNDALNVYDDSPSVMHVSGCIYPVGDITGETYFFRVPLCWGWATWERSWKNFVKNEEIINKFDSKMQSEFSIDNTYHYWLQLEQNQQGIIDTWFVYWYATIFLKKGLALFPCRSLVLNIGHDGTGVHCGSSDDYIVNLALEPIYLKKQKIVESSEAVKKHRLFFRKVYSVNNNNRWQGLMRIASFPKRIVKAVLRRGKSTTIARFGRNVLLKVIYRNRYPNCFINDSVVISKDTVLGHNVVVSVGNKIICSNIADYVEIDSMCDLLSTNLGTKVHVHSSGKLQNVTCANKVVIGNNSVIRNSFIGERAKILGNCFLDKVKCEHDVVLYENGIFSDLSVGSYSYIAKQATISMASIGKFCSIGPQLICGYGDHPTDFASTSPVFFSTGNQCGTTFTKRDLFEERKEIQIGHDVWMGARVFIRDGIKIGNGAIIAAGSVVVKDVPDYAIVGGVPARIIKYRFSEAIIESLLKIKWWDWPEEKLRMAQSQFCQKNIAAFIDQFGK